MNAWDETRAAFVYVAESLGVSRALRLALEDRRVLTLTERIELRTFLEAEFDRSLGNGSDDARECFEAARSGRVDTMSRVAWGILTRLASSYVNAVRGGRDGLAFARTEDGALTVVEVAS